MAKSSKTGTTRKSRKGTIVVTCSMRRAAGIALAESGTLYNERIDASGWESYELLVAEMLRDALRAGGFSVRMTKGRAAHRRA
jgi:hypothetical protein